MDSTHSPEFTMLEFYEAYGDYDTVADLTREMVLACARAIGRTVVHDGRGRSTSSSPGARPPCTSWSARPSARPSTRARRASPRRARGRHEVALQAAWDAGEVALELFEKLVEHTLLAADVRHATTRSSARPLARDHRDDPRLAEAWDLVVAGTELATGYSELVDPVEQRRRLTEQSLKAAGGDPEAMQLDEDFLRALEHGAPPMGGQGMGIDRLVMLLTGQTIRETILFPLVSPEP